MKKSFHIRMFLLTHSCERSGNLSLTNEMISDVLNLSQDDIEHLSSCRINNTLVINVRLKKKTCSCPNCGSFSIRIKEYKLRKIHHSLLILDPCILSYQARRYICSDCGITFYEDNPFSNQGVNISNLTILNVLKELKEPNATFSSVTKHHHISVTQTQEIFDRFVQISRQPLSKVLCMDEVYTQTSRKNKYSCLILDFLTNRLLDIVYDRKKYSLLNYFERIPKEERNRVEFVIIDMYETYRTVVYRRLPNAKIAVDSFHVIKNFNQAVRNVRIRIMKRFDKKSDEYYLLKKFSWLLEASDVRENRSKFNKRLRRYINYPQILDLILKISPELENAYKLKKKYAHLNRYTRYDEADKKLWTFIDEMKGSPCPEIQKMRKTLIHWFEEIKNSFIIINGKRLSNGIMESRNGIAKEIKNNANGYRNFARYRNRCLYVMNPDITPNLAGCTKDLRMHN